MKPYRVPRLVLLLALVFTACSNPTVTTPRELTADSNGLALHVRVAGDPAAGNVLIAIHGGPGMTSDYMLSLEDLAGPDLAVVTYDQRGVGRSASPPAVPASYTLDKYARTWTPCARLSAPSAFTCSAIPGAASWPCATPRSIRNECAPSR